MKMTEGHEEGDESLILQLRYDPKRLCSRRNNDRRLFRRRLAHLGPHICTRIVDFHHSCDEVEDHLDWISGQLRPREEFLVPPTEPLDALYVAPFGINNYHVHYSLNKCRRWIMPELLRENIEDYQDPQQFLRVSSAICRYSALERCRLFRHTFSQSLYDYVKYALGCTRKLIEFVSWDEGKPIHHFATRKQGFRISDIFRTKTMKRTRCAVCGTSRRQSCYCENSTYLSNLEFNLYKTLDLGKEKHVHSIYMFHQQSTTRHQLNSGFGAKRKLRKRDGKKSRNAFSKIRHSLRFSLLAELEEFAELEADLMQVATGCQSDDEIGGLCGSAEQKHPTATCSLDTFVIEPRTPFLMMKNRRKKSYSNQSAVDDYRKGGKKPLKQIEIESEVERRQSALSEDKESGSDGGFAALMEADGIATEMVMTTDITEALVKSAGFTALPVRPRSGYVAIADFPEVRDMFSSLNGSELMVLYNYENEGYIRLLHKQVTPNERELSWARRCVRRKKHFLTEIVSSSAFLVSHGFYNEREAVDFAVGVALREEEEKHKLQSLNDSSLLSDESGGACCGVCYAEASTMIALDGCGHTFCGVCWQRYAWTMLTEASIPIRCMHFRCGRVVAPSVLYLFHQRPVVDRYHRALAEWRRMRTDFAYCAHCAAPVYIPQSEALSPIPNQRGNDVTPLFLVCANCAEPTCVRCGTVAHFPLDCDQCQQYAKLLEANGERFGGCGMVVSCGETEGVRCGNCGNLVFRTEGCSHMTCKCGYEFCYYCGGPWRSNGYIDHWRCYDDEVPRHFWVARDDNDVRAIPDSVYTECVRRFRAPRSYSKRRQLQRTLGVVFTDAEEASTFLRRYLQGLEFAEYASIRLQFLRSNKLMSVAALNQLSLLLERFDFTVGLIRHHHMQPSTSRRCGGESAAFAMRRHFADAARIAGHMVSALHDNGRSRRKSPLPVANKSQ